MTRRPAPQALLGLGILVIGVVALLDQLDVVDFSLGDVFSIWWPTIIVFVGIAALATVPRAWFVPVMIIAVGVFFQLSRLRVIDVEVWNILWPVAIIMVGVAMLSRMGLGTQGTDDDEIRASVFWWAAQRRTTSQQFTGGRLTAVMGGIEVDLRQADIVDRAELSIFAFWGGVTIKVPPTWRIRTVGLPLMGGWEDKTQPPPTAEAAPELVLRMTAIMSGVEIKN